MTLETASPAVKRSQRAATRTVSAPTIERYIEEVRRIAISHALELGRIDQEQASRAMAARLVYGVGSHRGARGVCYFGSWTAPDGATVDLVEIAAAVQEDWRQLAGTVLHEIGHVIAGPMAGHSPEWADSAEALGFQKRPMAAGQHYSLALFTRGMRDALVALVSSLTDGRPSFGQALGMGGLVAMIARPCGAGIGTRGGKSRGIGSGSRLRLWECGCVKPVKVRVASDDFRATCNRCGEEFAKV